MEKPKPVNCPYEGEREVRSLYLAGKLPEAEVRAFEEHFFACERCAEAVDVGSRLRTALGNTAVMPAAKPERRPNIWLPLAAAAALALIGLAVWQISHRAAVESPGVLRGGTATSLEVRVVSASDGSLEVTWKRVPQAAEYVVQVFAPDGTSIWRWQNREPKTSIGAAALASLDRSTLTLEVEALNALGRVVASSELVRVPSR